MKYFSIVQCNLFQLAGRRLSVVNGICGMVKVTTPNEGKNIVLILEEKYVRRAAFVKKACSIHAHN